MCSGLTFSWEAIQTAVLTQKEGDLSPEAWHHAPICLGVSQPKPHLLSSPLPGADAIQAQAALVSWNTQNLRSGCGREVTEGPRAPKGDGVLLTPSQPLPTQNVLVSSINRERQPYN